MIVTNLFSVLMMHATCTVVHFEAGIYCLLLYINTTKIPVM